MKTSHHPARKGFALTALFLVFCTNTLFAQFSAEYSGYSSSVPMPGTGSSKQAMVRLVGKIHTASPPQDFQVEIQSQHTDGPTPSAFVSSDGTFEALVPAGDQLQLKVKNLRGEVVATSLSIASHGFASVDIRLPDYNPTGRGASPRQVGASVSYRTLTHSVPKKALHFAVEASKASAKGELAKAASKLESAVGVDPEFAEAWNNLGALRLILKRVLEAETAFVHAHTLEPDSPEINGNLALLSYMINKDTETIAYAQHALKFQPTNANLKELLQAAMKRKADGKTAGGKSATPAATQLEPAESPKHPVESSQE